MKTKKFLAIALALVMCVGVLTGCGTTTSNPTPAATGSGASSNGIVIAIDADIDTLHPSDYSTTVELNVLNQIYDTLIYMNPDGAHDPEARLAETWEASDDGLTYTFHLRDDATFHDGTPVTAEDVVFSLELYQNSSYQNSFVNGLDYAEATDDHTVVCHLTSPYAPFLLGVAVCHIASKAYYDSDPDAFVSNPIGSGPYKFVSRTRGSNVVLEAYDGYYRGVADIPSVTFEVIPNQATMAVALQTGEIDFAEIDPVNISQLEGIDSVSTMEVATSSFTYVTMNLDREPFNNVLVRQAINYALNRDNFVLMCYEGAAEPNSSICSPDRFGYSDDITPVRL